MFEENLQNIKNSVQYYKRDRNEVLAQCISARLQKSLETYYKTLKSSAYALSVADPKDVIKDI